MPDRGHNTLSNSSRNKERERSGPFDQLFVERESGTRGRHHLPLSLLITAKASRR